MEELKYTDFLSTKKRQIILNETIKKLKYESCTVIAAPFCGRRYFLRCISEDYKEVSKDNSIIINFQLLTNKVSIKEISSRICSEINANLNKPFTTDPKIALSKLTANNQRVLIIIDMLENISKNYEALNFLESLRSIDPMNIRFLLAAGIDFLTKPENYRSTGGLVTNNIVLLPPNTLAETIEFIKLNSKVYGWNSTEHLYKQIYDLSGGYPGLVKYICKYLNTRSNHKINSQDLLNDSAVYLKIQELFEVLKGYNLLIDNKINPEFKIILKDIGILNDKYNFKVKLLEYFINNNIEPTSFERNFTSTEFKIYEIFKENLNDTVTLDQITIAIWGNANAKDYSLWNIYKLISNMNKKIKPHNLVIKNKRSRGYYLSLIR